MENQTKLTIGMIITLALAISGTYYLSQGDNAYHCQARDIVMVCEKLSNVNSMGLQTRCYYNDTYKTCSSGWEKIEIGQEIKQKSIILTGRQFLCNQTGCVEVIK